MFGVETNPETQDLVWDRFREISNLKSKLDHTLTEYYRSFTAMCKRICRKPISSEEGMFQYFYLHTNHKNLNFATCVLCL